MALPVAAQSAAGSGALTGKVTTLDGQPVADATVQIVELRRRAAAAEDGTFRFDNVPAGSYLVQAESLHLGGTVSRVAVTAGGTAEVDLAIDLATHREEIVVTAGGDLRSQDEVAQPTSVIAGEELQERLQPTLGETLAREPGVSSTYFGPGASRPIIRGLGGDRIRVLEGGVGTGDASTTSPDHAVSTDPIDAERIEILRGPATLLYGSSAVGGVVNVISGRIPAELPGERLSGTVNLAGASAAGEQSGAASLAGAAGRLAWHLGGSRRETDDVQTPIGDLVNSAAESDSLTGGVSYVGKTGYLGVAATSFDTFYGSPIEEEVKIDLEQRRTDVAGALDRSFGFLRGARVRFGKTDYEHVELEGEEVGTRFLNDSWEGRLELLQKPTGVLTGSFGLQAGRRDFSAIGEESFVPPTQTDTWALFTFQEVARGPWRWQAGLRYEDQSIDAALGEAGGIDRRDSDAVSGSLGLVRLTGEDGSIGLSVSRSVKLPNAEELFSNGPHLATGAFEIGDPNLDEETNLGADLTLRRRRGRVSGELNVFANRFDGYIFESLTGEEEDGLQVVRFVQRDAEFRGAELAGVVDLFHEEPHHVDLELGVDYVRAELRNTGEPLPRIPPLRYRLGVHYRGDRLQGRVEAVRVEEQDRVSSFETPTDGYTVVNASVGYRFFTDAAVFDLLLRGSNLTDELARNHVSFLKDIAPLPGRDFSLGLRVSF